MKLTLLAVFLVILLGVIAAQPVLAFTGEPPAVPQYQPTSVTGPVVPSRSAPPWLGFILVFLIPFIYMIVTSLGKKHGDKQPPSADLPVVHGDDRPFRTYEDEDEA